MDNLDALKVTRFLGAQKRLEERGFTLEISPDNFGVHQGMNADGRYTMFLILRTVDALCAATDVLCCDRLDLILRRRKPVTEPKE